MNKEGSAINTLDRLVSQPAERIARLDAATKDKTVAADYVRTDTTSNSFDNRPTWDNWNNR
jgi:hypothetical protein